MINLELILKSKEETDNQPLPGFFSFVEATLSLIQG